MTQKRRKITGGAASTTFGAVVQDIVSQYGTMMAASVFVCIIGIYAISNPTTIDLYPLTYMLLIIAPILMVFVITMNLFGNSGSSLLFMKILGGGLILGLLVYIYTLISGKVAFLSGYTKYVVYTFIGLLGLGIFYNSFINYLSRLQGWGGFIAQLIFYIPCALYDGLLYLLDQAKLTPVSVYILLAIEVALITIYFVLPLLVSSSVNTESNGKLLANQPVYLNKTATTIASSEDLIVPAYMQDLSNPTDQNLYRANYCISMWTYINAQPSSSAAYSKETEIFKYGFKDEHGVEHVKPMIRYYGGGDGKDQFEERDKYVFYFTEYPPRNPYDPLKNTFYDVSMPSQKWNNIVLNYNRNKVDLFINGNLEKTFSMNDQMPVYNPLDKMTVGEANGLNGAVCNVMYYHRPLSNEEIVTNYNLFMHANPPINKYVKSKLDDKSSSSTST
jgi:hypothetical protein